MLTRAHLARVAILLGILFLIGLLQGRYSGQKYTSTSFWRDTRRQHRKSQGPPLTIVTAASANHFCAVEAFVYSLHAVKKDVKSWQFPRVLVYSLGINGSHVDILQNMKGAGYIDNYIAFDYSRYPSFWNIDSERGQYAWKVGIVNEVAEQYGGVVLWLDSGDIVNADFIRLMPRFIRKVGGFWSPRSTGTIGSFTHEGMFQYYAANRDDYASFPNCNGAALGFDTSNPRIVTELLRPWLDCATNKACIAPPGSDRTNHRQDQAAITFLAYRSGFTCYEYPEYHGLTIHQDKACYARLSELDKQGRLLHPSVIDYPEWTAADTAKLRQGKQQSA